jgi:hypothetical protein
VIHIVAFESHYPARWSGLESAHGPDVHPLLRRSLCAGVFPVSREQLESLDTDALLDMREAVTAELDQRSPTLVRQLEAIRVRLGRHTQSNQTTPP